MEYEVRRVRKIAKFSPNVVAVVNFPDNAISARAYIFDAYTREVFGSVEKAGEHFVERAAKIPVRGDIFLFGLFLLMNSGILEEAHNRRLCKKFTSYNWLGVCDSIKKKECREYRLKLKGFQKS